MAEAGSGLRGKALRFRLRHCEARLLLCRLLVSEWLALRGRGEKPAAWSGVNSVGWLGGLGTVSAENWWSKWVVSSFKEKAF